MSASSRSTATERLHGRIGAMDSGRPAFMLRYLMSRTWVSVLGLLAAGMAAIVAFFFVASSDYGGKLDLATSVVETSALYVLVGVAFVQKRRRLLAPLLALGAAALCTGIGLVAADSATYVFVVGCEFSCQNGPVTGMDGSSPCGACRPRFSCFGRSGRGRGSSRRRVASAHLGSG